MFEVSRFALHLAGDPLEFSGDWLACHLCQAQEFSRLLAYLPKTSDTIHADTPADCSD